MSRIVTQTLFLTVCFVHLECDVYQDRPKIKTLNGNLIIEPAIDKNIYLRTNGPKSSVFVGDVNILNITSSGSDNGENRPIRTFDFDIYLNGPNGILSRLDRLESRTLQIPSDLLFNISVLWRRVNRQTTLITNLRNQINEKAKDQCQSRPCQNGGTCLNLANGYHCLCPSNWEGQNCDVDVNECRNFAGTDLGCQNGATCLNRPGSYECLCRSGWFGLHCTRKAKDCSGGDFEMCGQGTCVTVTTGEGIKCICEQGWTTNGTGVACLTDVNECESSQGPRCSVNPRVECINLPGSFRCGQCPPGYEGDGYICSDIDECVTIPNGGCSTSPMVTCHNTIGSRICGSCPPGYQGDGITCIWRGSCSINRGSCHPSAQCIENPALGGQMAQCICPEGMETEGDGIGLHGCYIPTSGNFSRHCEPDPCGIQGQCHHLRKGYTCICYRGYGGAHCDARADYCTSNPCLNGGSCRSDVSSPRGFRCECTAQYSGNLCHVVGKSCGGLLQAEEGSIVYPVTNTTYNNNSRCAWVIETDNDKVINVTFSKFNLEVHPECAFDFLQIHDGRSSASQIIGRFCGNEYPNGGNFISNHNHLYFWFRSDQTVAKDGFALHWTSIKPVCGGEVDASSHGHISSPGSPGKYPPNRDCYWHLTTTMGKRIQLLFFALDIESHVNCSFDYIAIYDGAHSSDPLLGMYCNSTQPAPIQSASSELLIYFHSDAYSAGFGFQIAFAPTEGVPGCGGFFTEDKGELASPSYNGNYLTNLLCEYKIKTSADTKIRINFKSFKLESSLGCRFDNFKVYDGPSSDSRLVGRFCGSVYPKSYISSSNTLFLIFKSDNSVASEGFRITYESICQQTIVGDSGVVKSAGYPFSYPNDRVCEYVIGTTPGKAIQLTFQDFDIEDNNHYNCLFDNVEIRDGANENATLLGRYCGGSEHTPPLQTSTHNYMYVRFSSDISISGTGFYANFTTIDTECGGIYRDTTGLINHPSEDKLVYDNDQLCTWMLIAPEGMNIKLAWNRFDLENMHSCSSDYLDIIEIDAENEYNSLGKYCGTVAPPALTVSTNRLMLKFASDSSIRSNGFSVSYTFLDARSHCGGMKTKSHGNIYSPGWPNRYENNRECVWTIKAPIGQQIKLNISNFDLERPIRDRCDYGDYLEIRNGISETAPIIGKYCGSFLSKQIISTANTLYVHFRSDSYIIGGGFKIEWDSTITGCGGTLTSPLGSISSPNYPQNYHDNAECFYKIITSVGSRVQIVFKDIELERTINCRDDYVEIYDGRDENAPSLGRQCLMSPKLSRIETTINYAYIKFRSDFFIGGKGFLLEYNTICQNNLTGIHGAIESPGFPNNYPLHLNCLWIINVPKGNRINVTFVYFNTACGSDYLQIKESSDTTFADKICGSSLPLRFSSKTNLLQIKFVTGGFYAQNGFRLEWVRHGCGGHIQKGYGTLTLDRSLTVGELECEWIIEAPEGHSISFTVSDLYMTDSKNCTTDAIEIYNGQSISSPLITKICHSESSTVQSSISFMLVRFVKHSTLKDVSFTATFDTYRTGCGGKIEARSGIIHSKNYPKNYDDNLDCLWTLRVAKNHRIELNFMDFDLYSNEEDDDEAQCGDNIKIYEGDFILNTNYSQRLCPSTHLTRYLSKGNTLQLQFITDGRGTAKGFKANFTVTCGAIIIATHDGIIESDKLVSHLNTNCTWIILAPSPDQKISLTITHMSIPKDTDVVTNRNCPSSFLRFLDGNDDRAPLVTEYCGRKVPPMIVSRGSAITIQFGAYDNGTVTGQFSVHYTTMTSACGGTLTSEEGTLASPNYPLSYPVSASCEWTLSTSPGNRVYITFEQFDLEYSENCNEDYLEVRENNGAGQLLGLYCGTELPTNTTIGSQLFIKLHSDNKNSGRGFLLHYGFLHGNHITGLERGEVSSPLFPKKYDGAGEYTWRIFGNDTTNITITVDTMEIPTHGSICYNNLIVYDGYDADAPLIEEFCGFLNSAKVMQTTSNSAFIKLTLDETNPGSIFHISWAFSQLTVTPSSHANINCGFNETQFLSPAQTITINSPKYPNIYDNNLNCEWVFRSPPGYHLSLIFQDIRLEQQAFCVVDKISIYSSDNNAEWTPVQESICLAEHVNQVTNASNYLKVKFKTDSSVGRQGFQATVSSVCGGTISDTSGTFGPTWVDVQGLTRAGVRCDWIVKVRPGRVIKLQFEHFNITDVSELCDTFVYIRNGGSVDSPMLQTGKYCGNSHENRGEMESSGNTILVSYIVGFRGVFQNFKIRYEEKNLKCGATSKLDANNKWEVISSPNYPSVPVPYSECVWVFTGPLGEILRIDFIDRFDVQSAQDCSTEVVEIKDGYSDLSKSKGRFCGDKPGTIKTSANMVYIKYSTQLADPRNGFKANVSIDVCGGTIVANQGELTSPGYPHMQMLPYGTVCEWRIRGSPRQVLKIKPQDISLPEPESHCAIKITIEETMPVNNTVMILYTYCGEEFQDNRDIAVVETSFNEVIVKLHIGIPNQPMSDSRGFRFTFNSSRPVCGGVITTPEGYLTTPGYPRETTLRYCQWSITVPDKTRRVRLEILDSVPQTHRLGIFNDKSYITPIQILPSQDLSPSTQVFESSGHQLAIYLWPYKLTTRHRFKAKFSSDEEALCGGILSGNTGELLSPALERSYSCEWHYNSAGAALTNGTEMKSLYINVKVNSSASITSRSLCSFSNAKLTINSIVINRGSSFMRTLCGNTEMAYRIPSAIMDLNAAKSNQNSLYFHVEWKLQPCGGVVHVGENPVNILNLPDNYNDTLDCAWIVVVPEDRRVEMKLEGRFQLDCTDEFLQLSEGLHQFSPLIGDYCKDRTQENSIVASYRLMLVQYHSKAKNTTNLQLTTRTITSECGGYLTTYDNMFRSPNFPKSYGSNMECTWEIKTDLGNRISLQFIDRFVIEERVNCSKDAVIIYDWDDDSFTEIARLCGRQLPPMYNSTLNRMKVVLRTDADINLDGFKAMWTPICGGKFNAKEKEQFLYSPGYPNQYSAFLNCSYEIKSTSTKKLLLKFEDFELEGTYPSCEFDNVTFTGTSSNYEDIHETYCGNEVPHLTHRFNTIVLNFKTDSFVQRKGFKLSYSTYSCGGQVKEPTVISSGEHYTYDNTLNCTWSIEAPASKKVVLKFQYIDLESSMECSSDYIVVYDGLSIDNDKRLALMCGNVNSTTVLHSSNNTMLLQFVTDYGLSFTGFKVEVLFSYSEAVGCGGKIELTSTSAHTLKSPLINGSAVYENFLDCNWNIQAPVDYAIKIEFQAFHVSSCSGVNQTELGFSKCDCDVVEIKDGINPNSLIIGKYCGHSLPPQLTTSKNLLNVRLVTDGEIVSSGFEAVLSAHPSPCGQSLFKVGNKVQRLKTPGYDTGSIARGLHCVYHFDMSSDPYWTLRLTIKNMDLRPGMPDEGKCNTDKLTVSSAVSVHNRTIGKDYIWNKRRENFYYIYGDVDVSALRLPDNYVMCGNKESVDYYLTGSVTVDIQTTADSDSRTYKGLEIEAVFSAFCGRNYTELQGRIKAPYELIPDVTTQECYTLITAPENNTISVYFLSVIPDYWNTDVFLDVYDGKKTSDTRMIRIATIFDNKPVFSKGRYVLLYQRNDGQNRVYYDLNYVVTDKGRGCGGKMYNLVGKVTSPMYPEVYRQKKTCEWEIETPHDTRVRLHFSVFDLGRACDQNYVQLVDRNGVAISNYCSETPADYTSIDNYVKIVFTTTMNNGGTGWVADFVAVAV